MSEPLTSQQLKSRLDAHFHEHAKDSEGIIEVVSPKELLTFNRLDLAIKIFYLRHRHTVGFRLPSEIYSQHIKAFSLGSYSEPGNTEKNCLSDFLVEFDRIMDSLTSRGFDQTVSIIPRSRSGSISNGSHRVAAAHIANRQVATIQLDMPDDEYDYRFFLNRGMSRKHIEIAVTAFIEETDNCFIALLWPAANGLDSLVSSLIPNILYMTDVALNGNGAHNLLSQVYYNEHWLGPREKNFPGIINKQVACFPNENNLRIIAFQAPGLNEVLQIKDKVRGLYQLGKHAIHISDTKEEAVRLAKILLNENGIHFLNHGRCNAFPETHDKLASFRSTIDNKGAIPDNLILDDNAVLSLYGIRNCADFDYLSMEDQHNCGSEKSSSWSSILRQNKIGIHDLLYNPMNYFYYDDLKFMSFSYVFKLKKRRDNPDDRQDLAKMKIMASRKGRLSILEKMYMKFKYLRAKSKLTLISLLKLMKLHNLVRDIYRQVFR